jgi:hypothetical protein
MSITGCGLFSCSATAGRSFKRCAGIDVSELQKAAVHDSGFYPGKETVESLYINIDQSSKNDKVLMVARTGTYESSEDSSSW